MEQIKILLVDDDPEDRQIILDAMTDINAINIMQVADNGLDAIDILNKSFNSGHLPLLVVLDLNMPKMGGTQTLHLLKTDARFQQIRVIICSTSINPLEKEKCMALGAYSYITKPITYKQCLQTAEAFVKLCS